MEEPQSLDEINDLFWEALPLFMDGRESEISTHIWRIMQRVCKDINRGLSRKKIQEGCAETIGWYPSQQQIAALRTILNDKIGS